MTQKQGFTGDKRPTHRLCLEDQGVLNGDGTEVTERERAQNADFRRKPQIFADHPFSWNFNHLEGAGKRRISQKTEDVRNRRKPQIGLRHLRCVTFSSALEDAVNQNVAIEGALKERGQCDLEDCVPQRSVSSCDLRFRVAIQS